MKRIWILAAALVLTGCEKRFDDLLGRAEAAFANKNYTEAIDNLNLAILRWKSKYGTDQKAQAFQLLGKSYHALKKLDQAAESYEEAVKLSDKTFEAAYTLGVMHTAAYRHEQALDMFQAALRMNKDEPMALLGLGDSLFALKRFEEARAAYRRLIQVSPGVTEALANLKLVDQKLAAKKKAPAKPRSRGAITPHRKSR